MFTRCTEPVRADRLLSLLILLRRRGRSTAAELAAELEVSVRTVLRDVEALSAAGVPVWTEQGRGGGIALMPGWTTDLTGLTAAEALALATAASQTTSHALGLGPALGSAMRKLVGGLAEDARAGAERAAARVHVAPTGWLADPADPVGEPLLAVLQQAVFGDRRLRLEYARARGEPGVRTVDPVGLVHAGGHWYLLATHRGADRTYRVSRVRAATVLDEPAAPRPDVPLAQLWDRRRQRFREELPSVRTLLRVRAGRRDALSVTTDGLTDDGDGWLRGWVVFGDRRQAAGLLWSLGGDVAVLEPAELREELTARAAAVLAAYR